MPCRKRQLTYNLHTQEGEKWFKGRFPLAQTRVGWVFLPDIFLLGLLRYRNAFPVWLQLMLDDLTIGVVLHTEGVVQDAGDVIVPGAVQGKWKVRCWGRGEEERGSGGKKRA